VFSREQQAHGQRGVADPLAGGVDGHKDTLAVAVINGGGRAVTVRELSNAPASRRYGR